jgi:RNA polymerase sigma factor for flagellar operon FliA
VKKPLHEHDALVRTCAAAVHRELRLKDVELDDLVQYGYLGLLQSEKDYDAQRGVPLRAFLYKHIRWAMLTGLRDMSKHTRKVHAASKRLAAIDLAMEDAATTRPKPEAGVREQLGSLDDALGKLRTSYVLTSAAEPELAESPEEALNMQIDAGPLWRAVEELSEDLQTVVRVLYKEEDKVLKDLGAALGVSESQASRVHSKTLKLLQERLT